MYRLVLQCKLCSTRCNIEHRPGQCIFKLYAIFVTYSSVLLSYSCVVSELSKHVDFYVIAIQPCVLRESCACVCT